MEISKYDIKKMLPESDVEHPTDDYYQTLANYMDRMWIDSKLIPEVDESIRQDVVRGLIGYFQDVVADAGLWRSFVTMCKHLYGKPVPFYVATDDYTDFELNLIDVQFVLWYYLETELGFAGLWQMATIRFAPFHFIRQEFI